MYRSPLSLAGAVALAIMASGPVLAQTPVVPAPAPAGTEQPATFTLDLAGTASQVVLTVKAGSRIPLKIIRGGSPVAGKARLDVSPFTDDHRAVQLFKISNGGATGDGTDQVAEISLDNPVITATLHVPSDLPKGGRYTGRMFFTVPGQQPTVWSLLLSTAEGPPVLVLDRNSATVTAVRPMFCWPWSAESCPGAEPARVTVHVRDKTGLNPLKDVTARLDTSPGTPGAGSDPATIAAVTFNGTAAGDIFAPPPPGGTRDVVAQQQATMTLTFDKHLGVGEYTIPLRFTALNSGDDELQRLTVALKVRDPIVWAILVLLAAAAVSFLATRVVTMLRQRASFLGRVHAMRPAWLAQESPTLPVIWLRATLRQAEDLSRRFWLTGQRELDARLTAAEKMLTMLDRVRQVRGRINAISDQMVKQRATWKLDEVADELGAAPLTEQEIARLNAQLDRFDDWCSGPDKQMGVYWEDLYARIQAGLPQVKPFSDAAAQKLAAALLARLNAITGKPTRLGDMSDLDVAYRRLIILWEARNHADWLARIVALHLGDENAWKPIEEVYRVIDDGWWDILNDKQAVKCKVEGPPASTLDPPEAYETVVFGLVTEATDGNADPGSSYLMRKKLTYRWTITISTESSDAAGSIPPPAKTLTVVSTQPQMTQYSPIKGRLSASVAIAYGGRPGPSVDPSAPVGIAGSSDFSAWRMSEAADLIGFAAALMVSLFSGIKLYALGATFGSLTDYLALFTWGASLDQGKNFLQSLGAYSSGSPAAQGAAANAAAPTGQSPGEPPPAVTPPKPAEPKEAQSASPAPGPPPATGPRRDG